MRRAWISVLVALAAVFGLMAISAAVPLLFLVDVSLGSFVAGTLAIAAVRASRRLRAIRDAGRAIGGRARLLVAGQSILLALVTLTAAAAPGVLAFEQLKPGLVPHGCYGPVLDPGLAIFGLALAGWPISLAMRRLLW